MAESDSNNDGQVAAPTPKSEAPAEEKLIGPDASQHEQQQIKKRKLEVSCATTSGAPVTVLLTAGLHVQDDKNSDSGQRASQGE